MFNRIKDQATGPLAGLFFNVLLKPYGTMTNLQIDSKNKTITCELDLKGESTPLKINCLSYRLVEEGEATFFEITRVETSREWINVLCDEYLKQRRFKLPPLAKLAL